METPRTIKGKPCKKCVEKGSPCHIHGSGSRKSSPKATQRSTSPKSPIPWMDVLDKPAIQQILLNLGRTELNAVCNKSRRAKVVCDAPEFRRLYTAKHPEKFFQGKITEERITERWEKKIRYTDSRGSRAASLTVTLNPFCGDDLSDCHVTEMEYRHLGVIIDIQFSPYGEPPAATIVNHHSKTATKSFLDSTGLSDLWDEKRWNNEGKQTDHNLELDDMATLVILNRVKTELGAKKKGSKLSFLGVLDKYN